MPCALLFAADPSIGRLDYHSLSDQALMEILIDGMKEEEKRAYQDSDGDFLDVSEWENTGYVDDRVVYVHLSWMTFTDKPFPFEYIPPCVNTFEAEDCNLHGTLDAGNLPNVLLVLDVSVNKIYGTLNLRAFPRDMKSIFVFHNALSGSLVLADLPQSLLDFDASSNAFTGEIELNTLPPVLKDLMLRGNALTGSINIERLPESIEKIDLSGNQFLGDFRMCSFPESLIEVDLSENSFSDKAVLSKAPGMMHFDILIDGISSVVDEDGDRHAWHEDIAMH